MQHAHHQTRKCSSLALGLCYLNKQHVTVIDYPTNMRVSAELSESLTFYAASVFMIMSTISALALASTYVMYLFSGSDKKKKNPRVERKEEYEYTEPTTGKVLYNIFSNMRIFRLRTFKLT